MTRKERKLLRAIHYNRMRSRREKLLAVELARAERPMLAKARNRAKLFKTTISSSLFALSGRAQVRSAGDIPQELLAIIKEMK